MEARELVGCFAEYTRSTLVLLWKLGVMTMNLIDVADSGVADNKRRAIPVF